MASAWQERVIKAIREGVEPILAVRTLEEERRDEWFGVVLTYTNPGLCTLEFYVEWLDTYLAVSFHAPGFDSSNPLPRLLLSLCGNFCAHGISLMMVSGARSEAGSTRKSRPT